MVRQARDFMNLRPEVRHERRFVFRRLERQEHEAAGLVDELDNVLVHWRREPIE